MKYILSRISTKCIYLVCTVLGAGEKVALWALQKGRLVGRAKPNVPLVRWQKLLTAPLLFKGVREFSAFPFFCAVGCFIFSWVGLCVAKLVCRSVSKHSEIVYRVKVVRKVWSRCQRSMVWMSG